MLAMPKSKREAREMYKRWLVLSVLTESIQQLESLTTASFNSIPVSHIGQGEQKAKHGTSTS